MAKRKSKSTNGTEPTYTGITLPNIDIVHTDPQWVKDQFEYQREHPFVDYFEERFNNPVGREAIDRIDKQGFKKTIRKEWEGKSLDYAREKLEKRSPRGDMSRAEWLNTFSAEEEKLLRRSPKNQSTLWQDTGRGVQAILETNPAFTAVNIAKSTNLSEREKAELLASYSESPISTKLGEVSQSLNPLIIPSKMVQSAYKDDFTLGEAVRGIKNDAGILEDIVTDPLNLVGIGIAKNIGKVKKGVSTLSKRRPRKPPPDFLAPRDDYYVREEFEALRDEAASYGEIPTLEDELRVEELRASIQSGEPVGLPGRDPEVAAETRRRIRANLEETFEAPPRQEAITPEEARPTTFRELAEEYNRDIDRLREEAVESGLRTREEVDELRAREAEIDADDVVPDTPVPPEERPQFETVRDALEAADAERTVIPLDETPIQRTARLMGERDETVISTENLAERLNRIQQRYNINELEDAADNLAAYDTRAIPDVEDARGTARSNVHDLEDPLNAPDPPKKIIAPNVKRFPAPEGMTHIEDFTAGRYNYERFDVGDDVIMEREIGFEFPMKLHSTRKGEFGTLKIKIDGYGSEDIYGFDFFMGDLNPMRIGRIMTKAESLIPKHGLVSEGASLSLDSFQNMLARVKNTRKWKTIMEEGQTISLNKLAHDNKGLFTHSAWFRQNNTREIPYEIASQTVDELNVLIKKASPDLELAQVTRTRDYGMGPHPLVYNIRLPKITLEKLLSLGLLSAGTAELLEY